MKCLQYDVVDFWHQFGHGVVHLVGEAGNDGGEDDPELGMSRSDLPQQLHQRSKTPHKRESMKAIKYASQKHSCT